MNNRITVKNLESVITYLNQITGNKSEPYSRDDNNKFIVNNGVYYLTGAYGGHKLEQMDLTGSGSHDVLNTGFTSKKSLYYAIHTYIYGIEAGLKLKNIEL